MPFVSMTEIIPANTLSNVDRETFAWAPRNNQAFATCALNTIDLPRKDECFGTSNAQLIDEQRFSAGLLDDKTFWNLAFPPETLELCDTPMSLSPRSVAPTSYPINLQSFSDAPDLVEISRNSFESLGTWERALDVSFAADSTGGNRKAVDQRYACSERDRHSGSIRHRAGHAKQTAWRCPEPGCGKSYGRRDTFLRHQNAHKVDSHPCKICSKEKKQKSFKRKDHLKEHVRKCHYGKGDGDVWSFYNSILRSDLAIDIGLGSQKQQAVMAFVETMGYVLGDHDPKVDFEDLGKKMNALSDSDMRSVVGSMASVGATMANTILSATTGFDDPAPESGSAL